jgi:hypothetical protein
MMMKKKNSPESRVFRFRVSSLVGPMNLGLNFVRHQLQTTGSISTSSDWI